MSAARSFISTLLGSTRLWVPLRASNQGSPLGLHFQFDHKTCLDNARGAWNEFHLSYALLAVDDLASLTPTLCCIQSVSIATTNTIISPLRSTDTFNNRRLCCLSVTHTELEYVTESTTKYLLYRYLSSFYCNKRSEEQFTEPQGHAMMRL